MTSINEGHYLSHARRFVIAPAGVAFPVADGVLFTNGNVVLAPRGHTGMEVHRGGITALPAPVQEAVCWIDALRPYEAGE